MLAELFRAGLNWLSPLGVVSLFFVGLVGCDRAVVDNRPPDQIWREVCAACHGLGGEGIPHKLGRRVDMRTPEWQASLTDEQIKNTIVQGKKGESKRMPAWGERFSDEQVSGLVKHLREKIPPQPPRP